MAQAPTWFGRVAIVALIWNLFGCVAYLSDVMVTPDAVAKMSAAQQQMYAARPAWAVSASAIAVWGGALGCLGLVLRKRWSTPLLAASLAGVVLQDVWLVTLSSASELITAPVVVIQGLVLVIAVALVWMGRTAMARGWLG